MPYHGAQQRAIAAKMAREGKSREQIAAFFRKHNRTRKAASRRARR